MHILNEEFYVVQTGRTEYTKLLQLLAAMASAKHARRT